MALLSAVIMLIVWGVLAGGLLPVATATALPTATPTPPAPVPVTNQLPVAPTPGPVLGGAPVLAPAAVASDSATASNVGVSVGPGGAGALSVTVSARPASCTSANQLLQLVFGNDPAVYRNAQIAIDGQVRTPPFTANLPPGTTQKSFSVLQITAGQGATVPLVVQDSCGQWNTFVGGGPNAFPSVPSPTATRTAVATSTRTATPAQSSPTAIRTATAVPTSSTTQIEGVAVCTDHDPTRYHSLVKRDAQGRIVCTYGHEHKDDPHVLDALFGAPPVQDIDYPWHSFGRYNNPEGHNSFNWAVGQNLPCVPAAGTRYGFDNFRLEAHFSVINGDIVRFHSYSLQARGCDPADPTWHGTIQTGGWLDYGQLHIDSPGYPDTIVPLAGVFPGIAPFPDPNPVVDPQIRRLHGIPGHPRLDATWYGRQGCLDRTCAPPPGPQALGFNTGLRAEDWGAFDPANPATIIFYGGEENHSWHEPGHVIDINLPLDLAVNGRVTYSGFTDRWGNIVPGCTAVGPDCIPLIINNMKPGEYQFRNDAINLGERDYDVKSPVTGNSLIQFPN